MSASALWEDWTCTVRLVVTDPAALGPARRYLTGLMSEVEQSSSRFLATSDLSRVNARSGTFVPVGGRTLALVDVALDAAAETEGLVDPTIGHQVMAAGYDRDIELVRGRLVSAAPAQAVPPADWRQVRVDHELSRIGVPRGVVLDLGATAKAWTADVAAHTIAALHGTGVLVEIGGDLAVAGRADRPWQVHVSEIADGDGEQIGLTHGGLATSSTAARAWRTAAGDAHHIVDPRTGRPAAGPWRSATVWAPSAVDANTASTAALILGAEAESYLAELELPARLVDHGGRVRTLGAWPVSVEAA
ncbi:MAG: FAD:protein FMN transferase [Aeromicrobium sp.]|uniref:FAD:protein FMN transferase n=1 Tax=Aeromicrobium sp. TaxID=1871063 RepID=UPI0026038045|nr:FAD:protein FMN transferase [Aeromicrobium sp.]MDF1704864.1 FAD:protein FMN transferase [Aeromicrobium sp.]